MSKVVVIGGGIGGLASALLLSKKGHKVTLLEQYARVGGYATAWKREGITVEGVLHEIDDIGEGSQKYELLKELGVVGVEYVQIPEFYRVIKNNLDFILPHDNPQEAIINKFPNEKDGIVKYFSTLKAIACELEMLMQPTLKTYLKMALFPLFFKNLVKYEKTTVQNFLDECFTNEDIKFAVAANIGYYTDDPANLALVFFAIAQQSYYNGSGWFVKGGSQKFSDAIANAISQNGGDIITGASVEKIITHNKKACGVTYTHKHEKFTMDCDYIMNNASPIWAIDAINDKSIIENVNVWKNADMSPPTFVVYAILKGAKPKDNRTYSTMVFDGCERMDEVKKYLYDGFEKKPFGLADYGVIDSGLSFEDKRLVMISTADSYENWIKDENYEAKKDEAAKILIERAAKIYPDIKEDLISYEAATPLTNERYTKNPQGAIYGYAQSVNQSGRNRKKFAKILPNVINASAWGEIGGGYSGAFYNGIVAAGYVK
ncbi:MAG: hypothetical protein RL154_48 [Pseudomonadota bacterium]|jgi:phytoene dehydrogenase-like protein